MATLSVQSLGENSGSATLSGLSSYSKSRTVYFTCSPGGGTNTEYIPANSTSPVTTYFDGLSPGTTYRVTYSVWDGSTQVAADSSGRTFTTDQHYNEALEPESAYIEVDNYDPETGYASITVYVSCYNPNPNSVYGRPDFYLSFNGGSEYHYGGYSDNRYVSSYGSTEMSHTWSSFYIGTGYPKGTFRIRLQGSCYELGTSGSMATSGYTSFEDSMYYARPSKFYWISSSQNLKAGQNISSYITAEKWKELQRNINFVRMYKGFSSYSFATVSRGDKITASLYNQIANAINGMRSGTISTVNKGGKITAACMNALQNGINGIS